MPPVWTSIRTLALKRLNKLMDANLDITLVRKILNNEPVEILLHLLSDKEQ